MGKIHQKEGFPARRLRQQSFQPLHGQFPASAGRLQRGADRLVGKGCAGIPYVGTVLMGMVKRNPFYRRQVGPSDHGEREEGAGQRLPQGALKGADFVLEEEGEQAVDAVGFDVNGGVLQRLAELVFGGRDEPGFGNFAQDDA
jgi:hypothetical protein